MRKKTCAVYKIKNEINGKEYVGSTKNLEHRMSCHFSEIEGHNHGNPNIRKDSFEFPTSAFAFYMLERVYDSDMLIKREQFWINKLNPEYNYNKIAGKSLDGYIKTPEARKKHSITMTGRKQSPETVAKRVATIKANGKQKLKRLTNEQKQHLSEINMGEKNPNWGLKRSDETKNKQSIGRAKVKFTFKQPNGSNIEFVNLRQFSKNIGISEWILRDLCNHKMKVYNGWEFISKTNLP